MDLLVNASIVLVSAVLMEPFAWVMHRYVMHGFGWAWHQSHHRSVHKKSSFFERNDLYAVVFAAVAIALIAAGTYALDPLRWIGYGMTLYGAIYFLVHDGMVHQRWPLRWVPRRGYLKSLYQAHRLHHAVTGKSNNVSLGFLWTTPPHLLKRQVQSSRFKQNMKQPARFK